MSGNLGINTDSIARAGYTAPVKDVLIYRYPTRELPSSIKPRYYPVKLEDEYKLVMAKDGTIKKGKVVKYEEQSWMDKLKGEKPKELAKVKKEQVEAFLEKINVFGLGLKVEDIMSGNGTLNPNFKIDEKGNINFRNLKGYLTGKTPEYFETYGGEWAQVEPKQELPVWFAKINTDRHRLYPMLELQDDQIKLSDKQKELKLA